MKAQNDLVAVENKRESVSARIALDAERAWFDRLLADKHYLGAGQPGGGLLAADCRGGWEAGRFAWFGGRPVTH